MIEGQTDDLRKVTDVTAETPSQAPGQLADAGEQIIAQGQQAKITANASAASLQLNQLHNQFQIANQSDPNSQEALDNFKQQRQEVLDNYGSQVSPYFQSEWNQTSQKLSDSSDATMQVWQMKQTRANTSLDLNSSLRDTFKLANTNGEQFGNGTGDLSTLLNFSNSKQALADFGNKNLGESDTREALFNFDQDYMKSFVAGVAQSNPQKAAALLDNPEISSKFTSEQVDEMTNIIKSTNKEQILNKQFSTGGMTSEVTDLINDPSKSAYDKRLAIDTMDSNDQITPQTAAKARRVLGSQAKVDAVTDSPTMAHIVTQVYDLNANSDMNASDYLKGINDVQNNILEQQAAGKLSSQDVQKLNNEVRTLTSAKVSTATNSVGNSFYNANQQFQVLPPEMRGDATRQLFYQKDANPNMTDAQMTTAAQGIIDKANAQRRQSALQAVQQTSQTAIAPVDQDLLKSKGYTAADVQETAQKYGISQQDVLKKLRGGQ